ncbi:MAG TPA: hypothetical protein VIY48_00635 [Candidatus Paceibacterota bacterium]
MNLEQIRYAIENGKPEEILTITFLNKVRQAILDAECDGGAVEDNAQCSHCGAIFTRRDWTADNFDRPIPRCQFCGSSGAPQPVRTTETHPARSGVVSDAMIAAYVAAVNEYLGNLTEAEWQSDRLDKHAHLARVARIGLTAALEHFAKGERHE